MRNFFLCCFVAAALVGSASGAPAGADAEALLAKAIQAHGGEEALTRHKAVRLKLKATYEGATQFSYNREWLFLAPDKFKQVGEGFSLGRRVVTIDATDGKV